MNFCRCCGAIFDSVLGNNDILFNRTRACAGAGIFYVNSVAGMVIQVPAPPGGFRFFFSAEQLEFDSRLFHVRFRQPLIPGIAPNQAQMIYHF